LDISKIEAGKVAWRIESVDFSDLIHTSVKTTQSLVESKKIQLRVEIEDPLPPVLGDRDQLTQVLNNLLSNAIKFTQKGEITLFEKRLNAREILAAVKDTGIGLPPGELTKIFNKFYQVVRPQKDLPKGTGLGLAICREIIHYLGGKIWCESTLGEGSIFYFTLQIAIPSPDPVDRVPSPEMR
jgi:signal transduction histidine kinase